MRAATLRPYRNLACICLRRTTSSAPPRSWPHKPLSRSSMSGASTTRLRGSGTALGTRPGHASSSLCAACRTARSSPTWGAGTASSRLPAPRAASPPLAATFRASSSESRRERCGWRRWWQTAWRSRIATRASTPRCRSPCCTTSPRWSGGVRWSPRRCECSGQAAWRSFTRGRSSSRRACPTTAREAPAASDARSVLDASTSSRLGFAARDVLVPFHQRDSTPRRSAELEAAAGGVHVPDKRATVFQRYCHVYSQGEPPTRTSAARSHPSPATLSALSAQHPPRHLLAAPLSHAPDLSPRAASTPARPGPVPDLSSRAA